MVGVLIVVVIRTVVCEESPKEVKTSSAEASELASVVGDMWWDVLAVAMSSQSKNSVWMLTFLLVYVVVLVEDTCFFLVALVVLEELVGW
jgi:hypothetical protein